MSKCDRSRPTPIRTWSSILFKTGIDGKIDTVENLRSAARYLPDNIYDALADFRESDWATQLLGEE